MKTKPNQRKHQIWWHMPVTWHMGEWQEKLKAVETPRPAWATWGFALQRKQEPGTGFQFNSNTQEAEAGTSLRTRGQPRLYSKPSQPGLRIETVSRRRRKRRRGKGGVALEGYIRSYWLLFSWGSRAQENSPPLTQPMVFGSIYSKGLSHWWKMTSYMKGGEECRITRVVWGEAGLNPKPVLFTLVLCWDVETRSPCVVLAVLEVTG